jgi:hypothetical protein
MSQPMATGRYVEDVKSLIFLAAAGVSAPFHSRWVHRIGCNFITVFSGRTVTVDLVDWAMFLQTQYAELAPFSG